MCIKKDISATLAYFDLFNYPLKKREIFIFLQRRAEVQNFDDALNDLVEERIVFRLAEFYSLQDNYALAERRRWGNERAAGMLVRARKAASVIARFPFVRGVAISGSLSKQFADEQADIDFFIITASNRLWISRTILHLFKKLTYLLRHQHRYCMNYFIDEEGLGILERNIYTATEVATVMPVYGTEIFEKFYKANDWTKEFLPNNYLHIPAVSEMNDGNAKRLFEKIFRSKAGGIIENVLMNLTALSWNRKRLNKRKNSKGMLLCLHTGNHFAKPDPSGFQEKLLNRYQSSLDIIYKKQGLSQGNGLVHL